MKHITEPTLLINEEICRKNIRTMAEKAKRNNVIFRPHFKTPVSLEIGEWFKDYGVDKITVSSLKMAEYFVEGGWKDITVAFPVNIREIDRINRLAKSCTLNIIIENKEAIQYLDRYLMGYVPVFLKIDIGQNRTGIQYDDTAISDELIYLISASEKMYFKGFLSHAGITYDAKGFKEIQEIHQQYPPKLIVLKERYQDDFPNIMISIGDTPTCSRMEDFTWANEMRPGNFIFYDVMQWIIGSCKLDDIAVAMACPIVAKHEARKEIIIHGGALHFAKDSMRHPFLKKDIYGLVVELNEKDWSHPEHKSYLAKLSQEHGTLKMSDELFSKYQVGDLIGILPIHSCMTADCMRNYMDLEGKIIERM